MHVRYRHRVLGMLFLLAVVTYVDRVCISVSGTTMQKDLGIAPEQWGWVLGAFALSYGLFEVPSGALGDRIGPRRVLARIVTWWSAFTALTGAATGFWPLVATRFLFGAGEAGAFPNVSATLSRWFPPQERGGAQGFVWMASRVGGAVSPLLVIPLQQAFGWRATFVAFGAVGVLWAGWWWLWFRDDPRDKAGITPAELAEIGAGGGAGGAAGGGHHAMPWRTLLASPNLWWIMAMYFLYCWTSFFYLSWLHTFLEKARGYSKEDLVALSWLPFVCGGVANLLGGLASDRLVRRVGLRWGRRSIGVAGLATAAVFTGATFFTQDKFLSVLFLALGYAGSDFMLPVAWAVCLDVGGRHAGAVSGAMNMAGQFAGFLTSVAFGYIVAATGSWDAPLVPMTVTAALAAAAWLRIDATKPLFAPVVALCVLAACAGGAGAAEPARPRGSNVVVEGSAEEGFRLLRDGRPFVIRGAGGERHLDMLAACGGNSIRTWGAETPDATVDGRRLIDRAHELGIAVTVGIWLGHERHGFDYTSPKQLAEQRGRVEAAVRRFKDHPAMLLWGLGNEMEGPTGAGASPAVWKEVDHLARLVKRLDPRHPVMTVVANVNPDKLRAIREHAPAVDILGVNAYAGAAGVGRVLHECGWRKPYCITEFGLPGPWETEQTAWKAPVEPSSRGKAASTFVTQGEIMADAGRCLGSYVFLWGSKQEATSSWFGMFLPSGEKTPRVDAIARAWTGDWPANRAPVLKEAVVPLENVRIAAGKAVTVRVRYEDPEGDPLDRAWEVVEESTDRREGGDAERRPDVVPGAVRAIDADTAEVTAPAKPGAYRLFVTVNDGKGSASVDNWAFFVTP